MRKVPNALGSSLFGREDGAPIRSWPPQEERLRLRSRPAWDELSEAMRDAREKERRPMPKAHSSPTLTRRESPVNNSTHADAGGNRHPQGDPHIRGGQRHHRNARVPDIAVTRRYAVSETATNVRPHGTRPTSTGCRSPRNTTLSAQRAVHRCAPNGKSLIDMDTRCLGRMWRNCLTVCRELVKQILRYSPGISWAQ